MINLAVAEDRQGKTAHVRSLKKRLLDASLIIFAVILCITFSILSPYFLQLNNFLNILTSVSMVGIIATGMTLIIIARGLDLSVGSTMALAGCLETMMIQNMGLPWWLSMLLAIVAGLLVGFFNGFLVTRFKIVPFIATLGTMNMIRGIAFIITNGQSVYTASQPVAYLGTGRILGVPVPAILLGLCFVIMWWITKNTTFGRYVYTMGGNKTATRLAGINVNKLTLALFTITGGLSALAGMIMVGLSSTSMPSSGDGYNLDVITAVYLGGTSSEGGEGSMLRTLMGVLIIGIINNGMALLSVQPYWQTFIKGCLLVAAVIVDMIRRNQK